LTPPSSSDSAPNAAGESERAACVGAPELPVVTELLLDESFAPGGGVEEPQALTSVRENRHAQQVLDRIGGGDALPGLRTVGC
jgi:hypothetical protein